MYVKAAGSCSRWDWGKAAASRAVCNAKVAMQRSKRFTITMDKRVCWPRVYDDPTLSTADATASPSYSTVIADLGADRNTLLALWETGLVHHGMPEAKLNWYYHANPAGTPTVYFLQCRGGKDFKLHFAARGLRAVNPMPHPNRPSAA